MRLFEMSYKMRNSQLSNCFLKRIASNRFHSFHPKNLELNNMFTLKSMQGIMIVT